jgi:hypothetical protein
VKLFVNNPELWNPFLQELEVRILECHRRLEQVSDPVEVYRTQGEIQALRKLQKLRDKVNSK